MLSRSLRSAVQLAEVSLDRASWTALELLPQPWGGGQEARGGYDAWSCFPRRGWTREEASTASTGSKPEDAQVLLAALQHLFLLDEGRCWSLPSVALAGVERGAIGEFILQVRVCSPTSSPQIYRQGNWDLTQAGPGHGHTAP